VTFFIVARSAIFDILMSIWTAVVAILGLPFGCFQKTAWLLYKIWAYGVIGLLRIVCGINFQIMGLENLSSGENIILSKHQSMWETVIFLLKIKAPVYVLKKELLQIPFYGWYLKKMKMIPVDRHGGLRSLNYMIRDAKERLNSGHNVIIFPEGTRVPIGSKIDQYPYHFSFAKLYGDQNYNFIPVALNSGLFWPKGIFSIKRPGTIVARMLPAIRNDLTLDEFKKEIIDRIETESDALLHHIR